MNLKALRTIVVTVRMRFFALYPCWSMEKQAEIRRGRHCVFNMHIHLVLVTKYRRDVFNQENLLHLETIFRNVYNDFEAELVELNSEDNHVHLLINYPPKMAVSNLVNSLKGVSSRLIRKHHHPTISQKLWGKSI